MPDRQPLPTPLISTRASSPTTKCAAANIALLTVNARLPLPASMMFEGTRSAE
jgi:hypothetical protein